MYRLTPEEYEKKRQLEIKEKLNFYYGPRDKNFRKVVENILLKGKLKPYLNI